MKVDLQYILALMVMLLGGCTTLTAGQGNSQGGMSIWMVGIVRVELPDRQGKLAAVDAKTLGAGWDRGPYLGWKAGNWIIADPAECQLLIVIRSPVQAENAARILQAMGGKQPCVIDYTHSLHR